MLYAVRLEAKQGGEKMLVYVMSWLLVDVVKLECVERYRMNIGGKAIHITSSVID
jgi:hypothetical protein